MAAQHLGELWHTELDKQTLGVLISGNVSFVVVRGHRVSAVDLRLNFKILQIAFRAYPDKIPGKYELGAAIVELDKRLDGPRKHNQTQW